MADVNPYAPPSADVVGDLPDVSDGDMNHPPPTGLARAVVFCLGACALLNLVGTYTGFSQLELLERAPDITMEEADANDTMVATAMLAYAVVALATTITFGFWLVRANRTARSLAPDSVTITPGWSIGWFFVPIANLWKPYQAISEVWFASEMHNPNRVVDKPAVFPLWWTTWIFGSLLSRGSARYAEDAGDNIDKLITATHMSIADDLVWLLAAVFCILVVRSISGAQERGWRRRGSG